MTGRVLAWSPVFSKKDFLVMSFGLLVLISVLMHTNGDIIITMRILTILTRIMSKMAKVTGGARRCRWLCETRRTILCRRHLNGFAMLRCWGKRTFVGLKMK